MSALFCETGGHGGILTYASVDVFDMSGIEIFTLLVVASTLGGLLRLRRLLILIYIVCAQDIRHAFL